MADDAVLCGACGRPAGGYAELDGMRLCHGDDDESPTCYEQGLQMYALPSSAPARLGDTILGEETCPPHDPVPGVRGVITCQQCGAVSRAGRWLYPFSPDWASEPSDPTGVEALLQGFMAPSVATRLIEGLPASLRFVRDPASRLRSADRMLAELHDACGVAAAARVEAIRELRDAGRTYAEIGDLIGVSRQRAHRLKEGDS